MRPDLKNTANPGGRLFRFELHAAGTLRITPDGTIECQSIAEMRNQIDETALGTVIRILPRGFGFVDVEGRQLFFAARTCRAGVFDALRPGDQVRFVIQPNYRGPICADVHLADSEMKPAA